MTTYHPSATDEELLPIVDESDKVIGAAPRRRVHLEKLLHRAVHVVVSNGAGQVLLQLRSAAKDSFPGWWDISVGGHVDSGEDYATAAEREIREELGISAPLVEVARRPAAADSGWEFVRIYTAISQGPFHPPPAEIDGTRWVDVAQLMKFAHSNFEPEEWRVTPSGLISLRLWAHATGAV